MTEEHYAREPENLREALERAINRFSGENGSNTPDFILAEYLTGCLEAFDEAVKEAEKKTLPVFIQAEYLTGCLEAFDRAVSARERWYDRG